MTQIYIRVDNINVTNKTSMNSSIHHDQFFLNQACANDMRILLKYVQ